MTLQAILNNLLDQAYQDEKQFTAELSPAEREARGSLESWTAKDTLAHNSYWREYHAENILNTLEGKSPTHTDDFDHANEEVFNRYQDESWENVESLAASSCDRMREALNALGEEGLQRTDLLPWQEGRPLWRFVVGNLYTHPILHLADWHIKKGEASRAAAMYQEMTRQAEPLDDSPDWQGTIRYNLACSYSLAGESEKAIRTLKEALELNPDLTDWSKQDPDFGPIRDEAAYRAIYEE